VVYALHSPHMGGVSRWNVLTDERLSSKMPEVFDPYPAIVSGFMAYEAEQALLEWNPIVIGTIMKRGLLVGGSPETVHIRKLHLGRRVLQAVLPFLRRTVFDRFGHRL
jgi:hypothetical protein